MKPNDLIVYTENGLFLADKQELFNMGLNTKFTGWYCSSILNLITVNNVGTASSPICLNFILSHNIYNPKIPIDKPYDLMCSSWSSCSCDGDIALPKAINYETCITHISINAKRNATCRNILMVIDNAKKKM